MCNLLWMGSICSSLMPSFCILSFGKANLESLRELEGSSVRLVDNLTDLLRGEWLIGEGLSCRNAKGGYSSSSVLVRGLFPPSTFSILLLQSLLSSMVWQNQLTPRMYCCKVMPLKTTIADPRTLLLIISLLACELILLDHAINIIRFIEVITQEYPFLSIGRVGFFWGYNNMSEAQNLKRGKIKEGQQDQQKEREEAEQEEEKRYREGEVFQSFDQFQDAPNESQEHGQANHSERDEEEIIPRKIERQERQQERERDDQQAENATQVHQHYEEKVQHEQPENEQNVKVQEQHQPNEEIKLKQESKPEKQQPMEGHNEQKVGRGSSQPKPQNPQPDLPESSASNIQLTNPLPSNQPKSHVIIKQAQKQRLAGTYTIFLKYNIQYRKTVASYKLILKNVRTELLNKQNLKKQLQSSLVQYFQTDIKLNREFYQKSYKVQKQAATASTNKQVNLKEEFKEGYEGLFYMRKSLADEMKKLEAYITHSIKALNEAFENYFRTLNAEERRQSQTVQLYFAAQKNLDKVFQTIQKLFKKGIAGERTKDDIFTWIVKFINQQTQYRQALIKFGQTVLEFKNTYIKAQQQLFLTLQRIINEFKLQSRKVYAAKKEDFAAAKDYIQEIEKQVHYQYLCTITDVDYIKSVLELQVGKGYVQFKDQHFVQFLKLPFFDRVVGNKKELFKGAINKCFPLQQKNEELVHTISGNLVQYNRQTDQCKQKFQIRNLNVRLIGQGAIQLDQIIKGIVFSDNRTVRLKLKDNDRAQELICYLNEKDQFIDHHQK